MKVTDQFENNLNINNYDSIYNNKSYKEENVIIPDEQAYKETMDTKTVGDLSRKVKKGLSLLPIITVAGDAMLGASGLSKQIEYLKEEPDNSLNWLQYYECYVT